MYMLFKDLLVTFASDGPESCCGSQVARYAPQSLHQEFGTDFELLDSTHEEHQTPLALSKSSFTVPAARTK